MKCILLTQGQFALVDDEDFEELSKYKWSVQKNRNTFYAIAKTYISGKRITILMHRIITNFPKGIDTDHRNHNGLDNRKANLRPCTKAQNQQNCLKQKNCSSRYKGVYWHKNRKKWQTQIVVNHKNLYFGSYIDEIKAAKIYDKKAKELFGEFANLNFPSA